MIFFHYFSVLSEGVMFTGEIVCEYFILFEQIWIITPLYWGDNS